MAPSPRRGRCQGADFLRDLRHCALFAQASEILVVYEQAFFGPATGCYEPAADDARAPITAFVAPANLALFD